jgi:hypothetical protein
MLTQPVSESVLKLWAVVNGSTTLGAIPAFAEPATAAAATALHIPRLKRLLRIFDSLGHCPEQQPTSHVGK